MKTTLERNIVALSRDVRAIFLLLETFARPARFAARAEYSLEEFAAFVCVPLLQLKKRHVWRRYGGKKRGGRIIFSEAARMAVAAGLDPHKGPR